MIFQQSALRFESAKPSVTVERFHESINASSISVKISRSRAEIFFSPASAATRNPRIRCSRSIFRWLRRSLPKVRPRAGAAHHVHLPQPVLRRDVALREEQILKRAASIVGTPCSSRTTRTLAESPGATTAPSSCGRSLRATQSGPPDANQSRPATARLRLNRIRAADFRRGLQARKRSTDIA